MDEDIIDLSYVQEKIKMKKRSELLKKHPYNIWLGNDGYWHTYLPDEEKGRIPKKRKIQADLENVVIEFWKEKAEDPTVQDVFYQWINEKLEYNEISKASYDRYVSDFKRFFLHGECFGMRKIKTISEEEIERFIKKTIADQKLTAKGYGNLRTLIFGIFKKCKKSVNFSITQIINDMQISKRSFRKIIKEDEKEVFNEEELEVIIKYLINNQDIINLGLLLIFVSGVRVGELSTLKSSDIDENVVRIRRTETIFKDENGKNIYSVKEFPKTDAGVRNIVLPTNAIWIVKKIKLMNPFGEYLFEKNHERIKALCFRKRLYRVCNKNGIVRKSPHKARKTYGSILLDNGVDQRFILDQMGHTDILCSENHYHRNRKTMRQKTLIVNNIPELDMTK